MSWAQGNEEPHKAAVRASIIARKRVTPWSKGTQEDGKERKTDE